MDTWKKLSINRYSTYLIAQKRGKKGVFPENFSKNLILPYAKVGHLCKG